MLLKNHIPFVGIFCFVSWMAFAPPVAYAQWDDDWGEEEAPEDDEDGNTEKKDQPPVTAGGMYTKKTYPIAELDRPLTITKGILEVRGGVDVDVSAETALELWRTKFRIHYGILDNVELQFSTDTLLSGTSIGVGDQYSLGFEMGLVYDLIDFRFSMDLITRIPDVPNQTTFSFGLPFRYSPKPGFGIIALDKIMTFYTKEDAQGNTPKPDLTVGVGVIFQPMPMVAVLGRGEIRIIAFDPELIEIPITVALQATPTSTVDVGLEFTLGDIKNDEDPIANRSVLLFGQFRL